MFLIVGLGNPGKKYENTRHNIGFRVLDVLANRLDCSFATKKSWNADVAKCVFDQISIHLLKPQTFMNLSGSSVQLALQNSSSTKERTIIIYDDADLAFGDIRLKERGSSAGHNGIQSVMDLLGTDEVPRLRIGIGRPSDTRQPLDSWVLERFDASEEAALKQMLEDAADAVIAWMQRSEHKTPYVG